MNEHLGYLKGVGNDDQVYCVSNHMEKLVVHCNVWKWSSGIDAEVDGDTVEFWELEFVTGDDYIVSPLMC